MSNCCSTHTTKAIGEICPTCGVSCKSVEHKTLYHQVKFPEHQAAFEEKYYFCPARELSRWLFFKHRSYNSQAFFKNLSGN